MSHLCRCKHSEGEHIHRPHEDKAGYCTVRTCGCRYFNEEDVVTITFSLRGMYARGWARWMRDVARDPEWNGQKVSSGEAVKEILQAHLRRYLTAKETQ